MIQCDEKDLLDRLHRVSGQIQAVEKMYKEKRTGQEILQQIIAARASLASLAKMIVEAEARGCLPPSSVNDSMGKLVEALFKVT